jgi:hypothetical protein
MASHPQTVGRFVGRPAVLLSLLGLFALLQYLFLPLIYYSHFSVSFLSASYENPQAGPRIDATQPTKPFSSHESRNCPICQASSDFQDYGLCSLHRVPDCASLVLVVTFIDGTSARGNCGFMVAGTRAPPIFRQPPIF